MTTALGGVSVLELESQSSIVTIVHVDVGEWVLVGGLPRRADVLFICFTISPVIFICLTRFFNFYDRFKISKKISKNISFWLS